MKRILAIVLMIFMILPLVPTLSFGTAAAETPRFTFDISTNDTLNVGDTFTVTVGLKNAPPVKALCIMPDYDKTKLEMTAAKWTAEINDLEPMLKTNWKSTTPDDAPVAAFDDATDVNGIPLLKITFKVIAKGADTKVGVTAWVYGFDEAANDDTPILGAPDEGYNSIEDGDYVTVVTCNHVYSNAWEPDADGHQKTCISCLEQIAYAGVHDWSSSCDEACDTCGYSRVALVAHAFEEIWCTSATGHWHVCAGCGITKDEAMHKYDNACDATCNTCGYVRSVSAHKYDNACDVTCNVCGYTRVAPHSFKTVWSKDGDSHWYECADCGAKKNAAKHAWDKGVLGNLDMSAGTAEKTFTCTACGAQRVETVSVYRVTVSNETAKVGEMVTVDVSFAETAPIKSAAVFGLVYDKSALELISGKWSTSAEPMLQIFDVAVGDGAITFVDEITTGDLKLTLTFKVLEGTKVGDYELGCATNVTYMDGIVEIPYDTFVTFGGIKVGHDYKTTWDHNADSHWHTCAVCGDIKDESVHIYDNACDTDCNECGYERVAPHSYETAWSHDADSHWHACLGCSANKDKAAHVWDKGVLGAVNWQNGTADKHFACTVCEAEKTEQVSVYRVTVSDATALVGTEFTVDVSFTETTPIKSASVRDFVYDMAALELVGGKWVGADDAVIANINMTDVNGVIAFDENTVASGLKLTLTFKALESAEVGEYTLGCGVDVKSMDGNKVEIYLDSVVSEGTLTLVKYKRGDVNGDDKVDSNDAIYLLRYTLMPEKYPINQSGDMNGDGKTDSNDAIYLLRHTLMPNNYPLK